MAKIDTVTEMARLAAALADPTRLRLLNLMRDREVCVCYFVEILQQGQPKISRHLAYLKRAGLVTARREGKWMHYRRRAASGASASVLEAVLKSLAEGAKMQADLAMLERACCQPAKFVALAGAPSPARVVRRRSRAG
jgi:ArsR family transcriptional regulator